MICTWLTHCVRLCVSEMHNGSAAHPPPPHTHALLPLNDRREHPNRPPGRRPGFEKGRLIGWSENFLSSPRSYCYSCTPEPDVCCLCRVTAWFVGGRTAMRAKILQFFIRTQPHDIRGFSLSGAVAAAEDLYVLSKNTQSAIDSARFRTTGKLEHYFPNILIPFPIMGFDEWKAMI